MPEVVLVVQQVQDGVRHAADAQLQRRAVGHQAGDVFRDAFGDVVRLADHRPLQQRLVVFDQIVDLVDVQEAVPQRPRHVRVDLGHQQFRRFGGRLGDVHGDAQAAEAVLVRRADHDQRHVDRRAPRLEQAGNVGKEDRRVVRARVVHRVAQALADEESVGAKAGRVFRVGIGSDAQRQHLHDLRIAEPAAGLDQRPHQGLRLAASGRYEHAVSRTDMANGVFRRYQFLGESFLPSRRHQ